jgi:peptidoglycan/xylan/chitin deacetylase (PgdA/CDA1 family)
MKLLIVNFHYIRDENYHNGIYPRSVKQLSSQIDEISKYYRFISQDDLIEKIKTRQYDNNKYCLITFDDGLKEQMDALEVLTNKGVPGVFYVNTGPIRESQVANVHKLHYIRSVMDDAEIFKFINSYVDSKDICYPKNIDKLYRYDTLETKHLKYLLNFALDFNTKNKLIGGLFNRISDEKDFSKGLYMDINDIKKLDKIGCLGTHGDMHLPLATLSKEDIKKDIFNSISFLKNECSVEAVKSISYPYGGPSAVSKKVLDISSIFDFGLTMLRGVNEIDSLTNPLYLKRVDTNDAPGGKAQSKRFCI